MTSEKEINEVSLYPTSLSDTLNGDASEPGAMGQLSNLIYDQSTPNLFQCRPAVQLLTNTPSGTATITGQVESNGILYGMVASTTYLGRDEPFAYDIQGNNFLPISGITPPALPVTQTLFGDWVPPCLIENAEKVVVCHPGFSLPIAFGYLDFSGFTETFTGTTTNNSNIINGTLPINGIGPGYTISGTGIPANTTVTNINQVAFSVIGNTHSNTTIDGISNTTGMYAGQTVVGDGIPAVTTIVSVNSVNSITISQAATTTATGVQVNVAGQTITISQNATATGTPGITTAGGTESNPLWCVGNTTGAFQLPAPARAVGTFNTRFYFFVGNAAIWTDTETLNITNADQAVFIGDATPIVASASLPISTVSQGIIQALVVFKNNQTAQITGDAATNNLEVNLMSEDIGTYCPNSLGVCPDGIRFVAVDGVRTIQLSGIITDPDRNLAIPFIEITFPSRVAGAYNSNVYRVCIPITLDVIGPTFQDFWFDLKNNGWTGPQTFPYSFVTPYQDTFILASNTYPGALYTSNVAQNQGGTTDNFDEFSQTVYVAEDGKTVYVAEDGATEYVSDDNLQPVYYVAEDGVTNYVTEDGNSFYVEEEEVGVPLTWDYQPSLMTDLGNFYANTLLNSTIELVTGSFGNPIQFTAYDQNYNQLAQTTLTQQATAPIWGEVNWGAFDWGELVQGIGPVYIPWGQYFNFNRMTVDIQGTSDAETKIGPLHLIYEKTRYILNT